MVVTVVELLVIACTTGVAFVVLSKKQRESRSRTWVLPKGSIADGSADGMAVIEIVSQRQWILGDAKGRFLVKVDSKVVGYANANGGICRTLVKPGAHTVRIFSWIYASPGDTFDVPPSGTRLYADVERSLGTFLKLMFRPRQACYLSAVATTDHRRPNR